MPIRIYDFSIFVVTDNGIASSIMFIIIPCPLCDSVMSCSVHMDFVLYVVSIVRLASPPVGVSRPSGSVNPGPPIRTQFGTSNPDPSFR